MSALLHQPPAEEIGKFLTNLLGLETTTKEVDSLDAASVAAVATYVDDEGAVRALISCNLDCAAKLGGALTQIPPGGIEDALEAGELPSNLSDNLLEVFNIGVNVFHESNSHRLVFSEATVGDDASGEFESLAAGNPTSHHELDIQRYGTGIIGITTL